MSAAPLTYEWDGQAMVPLRRFHNAANASFVVGQRYELEERHERSGVSHRHQFAEIRQAWLNLPEGMADQFPSPEHLRKRALIDAGFYDETIIDAGTNAAALRVASYVRSRSDFSVVIVRGPLVVERVAKSQSHRAMNAKEFQDSKTAVLEIVAAMIGVSPDELRKAAA